MVAIGQQQTVVSWLKYFDVEYLSDYECEQLASLDVNDPDDRSRAMQLAVSFEFEFLNETSKRSMLSILERSLNVSEVELATIFSRVGMPFVHDVEHPSDFLHALRQAVGR
ncbi:hypothetical protein [Acidovorax sp.]|jgi:hypothetical protein|uniref:hypothetical protein n=1 Tax=Acidovorax sp. TaxID=1872122 RepID=UPI0027BA2FB6|nr:hypothetical protein [Acidovorax sp.]